MTGSRLAHWADILAQDLRHAARAVAAEKGRTAVVVLVLALGIGANAAMFGIVDRLLLSGPDHVREPDRVRRLDFTVDVPGIGSFTATDFGWVTYALLRDHATSLAGVAAYSYSPDNRAVVGTGVEAEPIVPAQATWDFFPLLGVRPRLGRFFAAAEDMPGAPAVVVLGYGWWQRRFGADPDVLGKTITIDGHPHTVIGVAPRGFTGAELGPVDAWLPIAPRSARVTEDWRTAWCCQWLHVVARLAPGVSPEQADAEATRLFRSAYTGDEKPFEQARLFLTPLSCDDQGREAMEVTVSRWLFGVSLVVLLIAAANVANLLLARALQHRREVAVHLALGISRGRLVRRVLVQSLLLAAAGGVAALAMAPLIAGLVRATLLSDVEWTAAPIDGRILLVTAGLALATGLATGLVPALRASRADLTAPLRGAEAAGGRASARLRRVLAVAQVTFSVVLLVGAGLFVRSFVAAETADLGVEPGRVLQVGARWVSSPGDSGLEAMERRRARSERFYTAALERARTLPGVTHAAIAVGTPFGSSFQVKLRVPGLAELPRLPGGGPYIQAVSPGYFATVGLDLLRGRAFGPADRRGSEPVAIVNRTMARTLWPGEDPLGKCLRIGHEDAPACSRVVGVVEDAHRFDLREKAAMQYYVPFGQEQGFGGAALLVRPAGEAGAMVEAIRQALLGLDSGLLWLEVAPLDERLAPQLRPWRLGAALMGAFGALALVIAVVGLNSLLAHMVAGRRHELGVRSALGAGRRQVLALVFRQGLGVVGLGLALGILVSVLAAGRLGPLLFATSPDDPLVYGAVVGVLLAAAALACWVPGRRAARVDPATVLRSE